MFPLQQYSYGFCNAGLLLKVQKILLPVYQSNANILCPDCAAKFEFEGIIDQT
jgi:hypothetical protein